MRILVAGGVGFLGSHLCEFLLKKQHDVICMDNLITGNIQNISHLKKNSKFKFIKHDVCKKINLEKKLDAVLHFASPASPNDYFKYPLETLSVGSIGTSNLLKLAKENKAVFLLASSSEIYGDPLVHPQKESYWGNANPVGPRGVYVEAKRFAEALTTAYHKYYELQVRIARVFNTYGPRMRSNDGRVIPTFISQYLRHQPLSIYGDGKQTRSFCYVSDLIKGIYELLLSPVNEPINLGNTEEITILELAKKIENYTNSKSKIVFKKLPVDDPKLRRPDITKAKTFLKWQASVSLSEGLEKTIAYFKSINDNQPLTGRHISTALGYSGSPVGGKGDSRD